MEIYADLRRGSWARKTCDLTGRDLAAKQGNGGKDLHPRKEKNLILNERFDKGMKNPKKTLWEGGRCPWQGEGLRVLEIVKRLRKRENTGKGDRESSPTTYFFRERK